MAKKRSNIQGPFPVQIERNGKAITGTYRVEGSGPTALVHVTSAYGSKSTQAGASGSELTAEMVLANMVDWNDFPGRS
jgi:hypothetical protein